MKSKLIVLLLGIMCAGLLVVGCGSNDNSSSSSNAPDPEPSSSSTEAVPEDEVDSDAPYTQQTFEFGEMFYSEDKLTIFFEEGEDADYVWKCTVDGNSLEYDRDTFMYANEIPGEVSGDFASVRAFDFTGAEAGICTLHFEETDEVEDYVRDTFSFDVEIGSGGKILNVESW